MTDTDRQVSASLPADCPAEVSVPLSSIVRGALSEDEYRRHLGRRCKERLREILWERWGDERTGGKPRFRQYTIDWDNVRIVEDRAFARVKPAAHYWGGG